MGSFCAPGTEDPVPVAALTKDTLHEMPDFGNQKHHGNAQASPVPIYIATKDTISKYSNQEGMISEGSDVFTWKLFCNYLYKTNKNFFGTPSVEPISSYLDADPRNFVLPQELFKSMPFRAYIPPNSAVNIKSKELNGKFNDYKMRYSQQKMLMAVY